ncbi:hypothetical protein PTSG_09361 [Salpingoeca rosetta]|uniref:RING-type E3 ubiquitin transferase n=1 Tax=Salpingoeca rosetta (strain ATCC 50818 / BSB-021) TaxID=946362 RepID=F2UME6_SALR5|nr:uncharacterized protein PTSG_09361 [Salpingoeca rosetta]EGD78295.1 hypothetical protein PTSG_09361 [Salpingoeca rosetta]|eukprot:XP_004989618.1 hypothetical protein PTSG_09361 [Salpingoeca rosetta]
MKLQWSAHVPPTLQSVRMMSLAEITQRLQNGSKPLLAAVLGKLEPDGKPLRVHDQDVMAWKNTVYEHSSARTSGIWSAKRSKLSQQESVCNMVFRDHSSSAQVEGGSWELPYQVTNNNFQPANVGVVAALFSSVAGRSIVGYETVDETVPVGLNVLGIGEFYLTSRGLMMRTSGRGVSLFTRDTLQDVINSAQARASLWRVMLLLCATLGTLCVVAIVRSELRRLHTQQERARQMARIMQARAQQQHAVRQHRAQQQERRQVLRQHRAQQEQAARDSDEANESPTNCNVCLDNACDTVIVPCGHMCMCSMCADRLLDLPRSQHRCPVCRTHVDNIIPVFRS